MFKHWVEEHGEELSRGEEPQFKFKLVRSFPDALTRQISESVRIDMRGGGVLNSKSVYSRCRVPRLTIEKTEWEQKREEKVRAALSTESVEEEWSRAGGAAQDLGWSYI